MVYDKSVDDKGKYGKDNPAFDPEEDLRRGSLRTGVATPSIQYKANENRRMLKNVIVISVAFMFLFTAFQSIAALQSSLNAEVGPYSLSTIYGCLIISSFFLPTFLISRLTVKYTLLFAMLGYIMYIFAQLLPEFYTMIPAAILTGLCAAPLWSAKCTYLTHLGHQYAALVKEDAEVVIVRFFGIFFFFFQSASVLGNLISSLILNSGSSKDGNDPDICGLNFCPSTDLGNATLQSGGEDNTKRYTLAGVFLVCAFLAAMIIFFLVDPLKRYGEQRKEGNARQLIFATFNQMKNPTQILLIPLTVWSGMEQGFFSSDFTAGFITCVWGVGNVGYVLICYGICDAISSISFGPVIKHFGRLPVFIVGALINSGVIVTLFVWTPNAAESWMFFVLAGLWGVADGIWQCEINAFYGILFPHNEEAAFSNYRLWESLGFIIAYINTNLICMNAKIYTLIGILILGMTGYLTIEVKERKALAEREQRK